jgi:Predicted exonuclease of the beta-lactamase fold involved in RNA processing
MQLSFFGATQTVTGSRYLLTCGARRVLIDCGLFQGYKHLRLKNWARLPFDPESLDAVLLTHAHLDHSGYLPLLVKRGFKGPIYATRATIDCGRMLFGSGARAYRRQGSSQRVRFAGVHDYHILLLRWLEWPDLAKLLVEHWQGCIGWIAESRRASGDALRQDARVRLA